MHTGVHRIYVVDDYKKPISVISLSNIITVLHAAM